MQNISTSTSILPSTNVLNYTAFAVANALELETRLENNEIITSNRILAENDAFVIQYKNSATSTYSYAVAYIEGAPVNAETPIGTWKVVDIATTDQTTAFELDQFSFITTAI